MRTATTRDQHRLQGPEIATTYQRHVRRHASPAADVNKFLMAHVAARHGADEADVVLKARQGGESQQTAKVVWNTSLTYSPSPLTAAALESLQGKRSVDEADQQQYLRLVLNSSLFSATPTTRAVPISNHDGSVEPRPQLVSRFSDDTYDTTSLPTTDGVSSSCTSHWTIETPLSCRLGSIRNVPPSIDESYRRQPAVSSNDNEPAVVMAEGKGKTLAPPSLSRNLSSTGSSSWYDFEYSDDSDAAPSVATGDHNSDDGHCDDDKEGSKFYHYEVEPQGPLQRAAAPQQQGGAPTTIEGYFDIPLEEEDKENDVQRYLDAYIPVRQTNPDSASPFAYGYPGANPTASSPFAWTQRCRWQTFTAAPTPPIETADRPSLIQTRSHDESSRTIPTRGTMRAEVLCDASSPHNGEHSRSRSRSRYYTSSSSASASSFLPEPSQPDSPYQLSFSHTAASGTCRSRYTSADPSALPASPIAPDCSQSDSDTSCASSIDECYFSLARTSLSDTDTAHQTRIQHFEKQQLPSDVFHPSTSQSGSTTSYKSLRAVRAAVAASQARH